MATVAPASRYANLDQLFARLGDVPPIRVLMDPPPGTATVNDVLAMRDGPEKRLCELVDGTLVDKSVRYYEGSAAELLDRLGVQPERIRLVPPPGTATADDLVDLWERGRVLCELVEGTLVEKVMGHAEGYHAMWLGHFINKYLVRNDIGYCAGADAMMEILDDLVRIPDVCFISWARLGRRTISNTKVPRLVPDLAVEIISEGNRPGEMRAKLHEYFDAGIPLVWYVYPETRSARAYTSPRAEVVVEESGSLDGGDVLPGFVLPLAALFERLA